MDSAALRKGRHRHLLLPSTFSPRNPAPLPLLLISPGAPDEWDGGSIYTCNRPILVGDEIWLYCSGSSPGHHGDQDTLESIGLAP